MIAKEPGGEGGSVGKTLSGVILLLQLPAAKARRRQGGAALGSWWRSSVALWGTLQEVFSRFMRVSLAAAGEEGGREKGPSRVLDEVGCPTAPWSLAAYVGVVGCLRLIEAIGSELWRGACSRKC